MLSIELSRCFVNLGRATEDAAHLLLFLEHLPVFLKLMSVSKIDRNVQSEYRSAALIKVGPAGTVLYVWEIITLDILSENMTEI